MIKILLVIVSVGLLILFMIGVFVAKVIGKGAKMMTGHRHKHFTSSGIFHNPNRPTHFGHKHYRKKHSSFSFFSS